METLSPGSIELTIYEDRQTPGRHIELIRYEPDTDSFVIREYFETSDGELDSLCSGHSLFRTVLERRLESERFVAHATPPKP